MKIIMLVVIMLMIAGTSMAELGDYFPDVEVAIISRVAREYQLTPEETRLLFTIRRLENSGAKRITPDGHHIDGNDNGMEFGVGDGIPSHPARRYRGNFKRSLRLQAQWAAGTIQKHYDGNIATFAKRWCPVNHQWWSVTAIEWMQKLN